MRPPYGWHLRSRTLELGPRTIIMGVLNVTPDSFSDGGLYYEPTCAVERALQMLDEGADIVDIGGESTRPGVTVGETPGTSAEEELCRVMPVFEGIFRSRPDAILSVDTYKSQVAREALQSGAEIVNDVSGFEWDAQMAQTCGELKCGVVLMHTRGRPDEWRSLPPERNILAMVEHDLANRVQAAFEHRVQRNHIVLDPGFGFGKNFEENYPLLAGLGTLQRLGFPLMAGTSRKSFIVRSVSQRSGKKVDPEGRLYGSIAAMVAGILNGVHIVRVHDVKPAVEAAAVADDVLAAANEQ